MRPIQLAAHTRELTTVLVNRDGDLVFTAAKDATIMVWFVDNGERLGTYNGHKGAVNDIAVDFDSRYLLSAAAEGKCGIWEVETGKLIRFLRPGVKSTARMTAVDWCCGDNQFLVAVLEGTQAYIAVYDFNEKLASLDQKEPYEKVKTIPSDLSKQGFKASKGHQYKIVEAKWGPVNEFIYTGSEDGTLRKWDVKSGEEALGIPFSQDGKVHITSMSFSRDKTLLVVSGKDHTARIFTSDTLEQVKVFTSNKPIFAAYLHPTLNLCLMAGGQEAMDVTTTGHEKGKFEVEFFHTIYEDKIGEVRTGHYSTLTNICCSNTGSHFFTGAWEGNCRIFKLDPDFEKKFKALEEEYI